MFLVVVEISQSPPDFVSVFVPSVVTSRACLASSSVVKELGYMVHDFWINRRFNSENRCFRLMHSLNILTIGEAREE